MKKTKVIISMILVTLLMGMSVICVSANSEDLAAATDSEYISYAEEFLSNYTFISNDTSGEEKVYGYSTELIYEHYSNDGSEVSDYLVLFVHCNGNADLIYYEESGYYYCGHWDSQYDYTPSYLVFDTATKEVSWFSEALEKDFDKYFAFISESNYERIIQIGDVNRDNELNVKDATEIQKNIVGIETCYNEYNDMLLGFMDKMHGKWERYISDFNRDGNRNIKDATAIQKYLAGIEL